MIENSKRSSERTGGPAVRLPSASYRPPWHGQPKLAASTGRSSTPLTLLRRLLVDRPVRLHRAAEVDAAAEERREARHAVLGEAVVADERGATRDLALLRVLEEGGDHVLALGEVRDRPEVDVERLDALADERRQHGEAEHGERHGRADRARRGRPWRRRGTRRGRTSRRALARLARHRRRDGAPAPGSPAPLPRTTGRDEVAHPEEAEERARSAAPSEQHRDADDEPDEDAPRCRSRTRSARGSGRAAAWLWS